MEAVMRPRGVLKWMLTALALAGISRFLIWMIFGSRYPGDLSVPEGALIHWVREWMRPGGVLYADLSEPPYAAILYTPVPLAIVRGLASFFADPFSLDLLYGLGRGWTFFATALSALMLGLLSRSWMWAGVFLLLPAMARFTASFRTDYSAMAFTGIALWLATRGRSPRSFGRELGIAGALILAFFSKQTYVAAPIAFAVAMGWGGDSFPRLSRRFWILFAMGLGVVFGALVWTTEGRFLEHSFGGNLVKGVNAAAHEVMFYGFLSLAVPLLLFSKPNFRTLPWRYFAITFGLHAVAVWKPGSDNNYFIEPFFAWLWAVSTTLRVRSGMPWRVALCALLMVAAVVRTERWELGHLRRPHSRWTEWLERLKQEPGELLSADASLALRHGGTIWMTDALTSRLLAEQGRINLSRLLTALEDGQIGKVTSYKNHSPEIPNQVWPEAVRLKILEHFVRSDAEHAAYVLWVRKAPAEGRTGLESVIPPRNP